MNICASTKMRDLTPIINKEYHPHDRRIKKNTCSFTSASVLQSQPHFCSLLPMFSYGAIGNKTHGAKHGRKTWKLKRYDTSNLLGGSTWWFGIAFTVVPWWTGGDSLSGIHRKTQTTIISYQIEQHFNFKHVLKYSLVSFFAPKLASLYPSSTLQGNQTIAFWKRKHDLWRIMILEDLVFSSLAFFQPMTGFRIITCLRPFHCSVGNHRYSQYIWNIWMVAWIIYFHPGVT